MLHESFSWDKLSVIAGLILYRFYFCLYNGIIRGPHSAEFLQSLFRHIPGKLLVVSGGADVHHSQSVMETLARSNGCLWMERLPAYVSGSIRSNTVGRTSSNTRSPIYSSSMPGS